MNIEKIDEKKLREMILEAVGQYLDLSSYKVFFFGSRVDGDANKRSDIDLGIEGAAAVKGVDFIEIKSALEDLPILYKIDLVDFANVSEEFKKVAKKNVEYLN